MIIISAFLCMLGIALGAMGEHLLSARLTLTQFATFKTAVDYHQLYAIVLFLLSLYQNRFQNCSIIKRATLVCFLAAICIFSGSLYLYLITGVKAFVWITPLGGFGLILSWAYVLTLAFKTKFTLNRKDL